MGNILGLGRILKSKIDYKDIENDLRIENPVYTKLKRLGKYIPSNVPEHLDFFYEDDKYFYVPRYYSDAEKNLVFGQEITTKFNITLRRYQNAYFRENNLFDIKIGSFILNAKTGNGKTVMALKLIGRIAKKTLVVCETKYLVNQWVNRIEHFAVKESSGKNNIYNIISNKTKLDVFDNTDIMIITLKGYNSLNEFARAKLSEIVGTLVMDEGHRLGAQTFYPILEQLPARHRILLTATLRRKDEMIKILRPSFGNLYVLPNKLPPAELSILRTGTRFNSIIPKSKFIDKRGVDHTDKIWDLLDDNVQKKIYETKEYFAYEGKVFKNSTKLPNVLWERFMKCQSATQNVDLMKFLGQEKSRRKKLLLLIREAVANKRRVLVASPFIEAMYDIKEALKELNVFILDGDTNAKLKPHELEKAFEGMDVILGSMKVVQEGMDVDWLDTLIIYWPLSDIEQLVGRITRILPGKPVPKVIYFMDNIPFSFAMVKKAQEFDDNFIIKGTFDFSEILYSL